MKPIIFLDVDGVLNSSAWFDSFGAPDVLDKAMKEADDWRFTHIDPAAVARLRRIVLEADAEIVVSSTWRYGNGVPRLVDLLVARGFPEAPQRIIGETPDLGRLGRVPRCGEILTWLQHSGQRPFVILDDDTDANVHGHFVHTSYADGLTDRHADSAIQMLKGQASVSATFV